jgi:hypothetical protein
MRSVTSNSPFRLRVSHHLDMPRFQPPPRRTQHAAFPHCALLFASPQGLWDLSCRGDFRQRLLVLDLDGLACDARCLRGVGDGAKGLLGLLLHACLVLSRRILDHLRVDRERMKRRQDSQDGDFGADPLGQGDATAFPASSDPSVGIRMLVYMPSP